MNLNKDHSVEWSRQWPADPASQFSCSFADMRWPSAIMKHRPTQLTTGSIRLPHRHTLFPKGWPRLPQRRCVSEDVRHTVGKDRERWGSRESWLPQPLPSFVFGACCRNLTYGRHHTPGKGRVGAEGQWWFSGALQKLGLGVVSTWQSWIMPASPVNVATGSQVSWCFVAGFLCDLFFLNGDSSWAAVNFVKPQHCVRINHQEGVELEVLVPACSFSLSPFTILVKLPSLELSVVR